MSEIVVPAVDRVHTSKAANEKDTLVSFLDHHRDTLLWKCEGLTAAQLKERAVPPSPLSLLGLVRHLTDVERGWFRRGIGGVATADAPPIYYSDADPEGDFDNVDEADAAADVATYRAEIELCRQAINEGPGLDVVIEDDLTVRWILFHMLEEYARHNGHADLLRERIDGAHRRVDGRGAAGLIASPSNARQYGPGPHTSPIASSSVVRQ
ncbi:MAG: DinB family protein [Acidimicrobiales bacterium]